MGGGEVVGGCWFLLNRLCSAKDSCLNHPRGDAKTPDAGTINKNKNNRAMLSVCMGACIRF